jgi:uncharacterized protein (DUF849 family)
MTARPHTPESMAKAVARLVKAGARIARARLTPEGEMVIDFATEGGQPADPFDLVDLRK